MAATTHVFVSYSRVDRVFAEDLRGKLVDQSFTVWRDLHDMEPGR